MRWTARKTTFSFFFASDQSCGNLIILVLWFYILLSNDHHEYLLSFILIKNLIRTSSHSPDTTCVRGRFHYEGLLKHRRSISWVRGEGGWSSCWHSCSLFSLSKADRAQVVRGSDPIESRIPAPQNFSYLMTLPVAKRINLVSQLSSLKTKFHQHIIFYQKIYRFEEDGWVKPIF